METPTSDFMDLIPTYEERDAHLKDNCDWFYENRLRLRNWYDRMYIAVYRRHVIATFNSVEDAERWLSFAKLEGRATIYRCCYDLDDCIPRKQLKFVQFKP